MTITQLWQMIKKASWSNSNKAQYLAIRGELGVIRGLSFIELAEHEKRRLDAIEQITKEFLTTPSKELAVMIEAFIMTLIKQIQRTLSNPISKAKDDNPILFSHRQIDPTAKADTKAWRKPCHLRAIALKQKNHRHD